MKRTRALLPCAALLLLLAGCGDPADHPKQASSSGAAPSSSTSTAASTPTPTSGVSASHPGRLRIVPADTGTTACAAQNPAGIACQGTHAYRFQPEAVRTVAVVSAEATRSVSGGWAVDVGLDAAGARTLLQVTTSAARTHEFVLLLPAGGGPVISAAQVMSPIRGGKLQIAGPGGRAAAQKIVNQITRTAR